jgi:hypothetical protein
MNIAPGAVLELTADQWEFSDGPLRIRVIRVLNHLTRYYDGKKVWIDGVRLDETDLPIEHLQVLIRVDDCPG